MDFCTPPGPPPPHGSMQWYVSAYFRTAHDTPHSVSAPPPPRKILNWLRMAWNGEKSKKKNCHLVTPTRKKLRKISIITENFFFEIFNFLDVSDDSEQLSKKLWKKFLEIFLSFFSGGVTKEKIFFFDFSPFQAILSRFWIFPIFCKIDLIGGGVISCTRFVVNFDIGDWFVFT